MLEQTVYVDKIVDEYFENRQLEQRDENIPLDPELDYRLDGDKDTNTANIQKQVGQLRWLADHTRPDILYATSALGSKATNPHENHLKGVSHIMNYLHSTRSQTLNLGGSDMSVTLLAMTDASYIPYADSKSQLAYAIYINKTSGSICSRSCKASLVAHSSFDCEMDALDTAVRKIVELRGLLSELGQSQVQPSKIYVDNEAMIMIAESHKISDKSAHIVMRINYINQEIKAGTVVLYFIETGENIADMHTKALIFPIFIHHQPILLQGFGGMELQTKKRKLECIITAPYTKKALRSSNSNTKAKL
jgi:hypothetical protein